MFIHRYFSFFDNSFPTPKPTNPKPIWRLLFFELSFHSSTYNLSWGWKVQLGDWIWYFVGPINQENVTCSIEFQTRVFHSQYGFIVNLFSNGIWLFILYSHCESDKHCNRNPTRKCHQNVWHCLRILTSKLPLLIKPFILQFI